MEIILIRQYAHSQWLKRLFLSLGMLAVSAQALAQDSKVAIFDSQRVMRESVPAKSAEAKIEQEFSKRGKELQEMAMRIKAMAEKLDKDAPVLSDAERLKRQREFTDLDQDFKRKQRIFNEDLNQRKNEEIAALVERAAKAVKQIAEAEKYDIVLQDAFYANPKVDITDKVLKLLAK
jgi:outer membrane protein